MSRNLNSSFSNLGSKLFGCLQFFSNFLTFQLAAFQHFTSTIGKVLAGSDERGTFFRLQVYERVDNSLVERYIKE